MTAVEKILVGLGALVRTTGLLAFILIATSFVRSLKAKDVIKDKSPDGKFALRVAKGEEDREAAIIEDAVSVRVHGKGNLGAKPRVDAIAEILVSIRERRS